MEEDSIILLWLPGTFINMDQVVCGSINSQRILHDIRLILLHILLHLMSLLQQLVTACVCQCKQILHISG